MQWLNEPVSWQRTADTITVSVDPATDFWRETGYGYIRDSGHIYGDVVAGDLDISVRVRGTFSAQFDQAGIMLRVDDRTWLKTGMEFFEGRARLSTVLTLGQSSWMVTDLPGRTDEITLRASRRGDAVEVRYQLTEDGPAELAALVYLPPGRQLLAGVMCAAPEGPGFGVTFTDLYLAATEWGAQTRRAGREWPGGDEAAWRDEAPAADTAGWDAGQPQDGPGSWQDDDDPGSWLREPAGDAGDRWPDAPDEALDVVPPAGASRGSEPDVTPMEEAVAALDDAAFGAASDTAPRDLFPGDPDAPDLSGPHLSGPDLGGPDVDGTAPDGAWPGTGAAGDSGVASYLPPAGDAPAPGGRSEPGIPGGPETAGEPAGHAEPAGPAADARRGRGASERDTPSPSEHGRSKHRRSRKDRKAKESAPAAAAAGPDRPAVGDEPQNGVPSTAGHAGPAPGMAAAPEDDGLDDTSPGTAPGGFAAVWAATLQGGTPPSWSAGPDGDDTGPSWSTGLADDDAGSRWSGTPAGPPLDPAEPPADPGEGSTARSGRPAEDADPPGNHTGPYGNHTGPPGDHVRPWGGYPGSPGDRPGPLADGTGSPGDEADPLRDTDPGIAAPGWPGIPAGASDDSDDAIPGLRWATPPSTPAGRAADADSAAGLEAGAEAVDGSTAVRDAGPEDAASPADTELAGTAASADSAAPEDGAVQEQSAATEQSAAAEQGAAAEQSAVAEQGAATEQGAAAEQSVVAEEGAAGEGSAGSGHGASSEDGEPEEDAGKPPQPGAAETPALEWLNSPPATTFASDRADPEVDPVTDWERLVAGSRATAWTPARYADVSDDSWPGPPLVAREQAMNGNAATPQDTGGHQPQRSSGGQPPAAADQAAGDHTQPDATMPDVAAEAANSQPPAEAAADDGDEGGEGGEGEEAPKPAVPEPAPGRSGPFPVLSRWARSKHQAAEMDAPPDPADEWISLLTADSDD